MENKLVIFASGKMNEIWVALKTLAETFRNMTLEEIDRQVRLG